MLSRSDVQEISRLPRPVLTAYLNTQPADPSHHLLVPAHITWLKEHVQSFETNLPVTERDLFREQVARVTEFLRDRQPHERSVAVFAGRNVWQFVQLQVSVKNDLRWGAAAIAPLLWLIHEHHPYCIVVIDRTGARFFRYQLRELRQLEDRQFAIDISKWKRMDLGHVTGQQVHKSWGSQRDAFDHRVEAQYERLCREAAQQSAAICQREKLRAIFLVGEERLIELVEAALPSEFRRRVKLVKEDLGRSSLRELQDRLEPEIEMWEAQQEIALVDDLLAGGQGTVIEVEATLAKLQKGKTRLLVVAREFNPEVRQCISCGSTDRSGDPTCSKCGATRKVAALNELLAGHVINENVELQIVSGDAGKRLREAGGIGGWLRSAKQVASR